MCMWDQSLASVIFKLAVWWQSEIPLGTWWFQLIRCVIRLCMTQILMIPSKTFPLLHQKRIESVLKQWIWEHTTDSDTNPLTNIQPPTMPLDLVWSHSKYSSSIILRVNLPVVDKTVKQQCDTQKSGSMRYFHSYAVADRWLIRDNPYITKCELTSARNFPLAISRWELGHLKQLSHCSITYSCQHRWFLQGCCWWCCRMAHQTWILLADVKEVRSCRVW